MADNVDNPLSGVQLLIATPCHDGKVTEGYLRSVTQLTHMLRDNGAQCHLCTPGGESLITRARNGLMGYFIVEQSFTHMLFIDSDLHFDPQLVIKMLVSGHDLVGGCYPLKQYDMRMMRNAINKYSDDTSIYANSLIYCFTGETDSDGNVSMEILDGFAQVKDVGTGLMLISRKCADRMCEEYPQLHCGSKTACCGYDHIHPEINSNFWLFFETSFDDDEKRYLSEDYHFCKLWRDIGGEVWMDTTSSVIHTGIGHYRGHIGLTLDMKKEDDSE